MVQSWSNNSPDFVINKASYKAITLFCTGLKPNTLHEFLIDGVLSEDVVPLYQNAKVASITTLEAASAAEMIDKPLISDTEGKLRFVAYIPVSTNQNFDSEFRAPSFGSDGYTTLEIRSGSNSVAKYVIRDRNPMRSKPYDPVGNI